MARRPFVALLAFASVLAAVLVACGEGEDDPMAAPTRTRTLRPTATITATPSPVTRTPTPPPPPPPTATRPPAPSSNDQPPPSGSGPPKASGISLPPGFTAFTIAEGFSRPTSVAVGPGGELYVSQRHGPVHRLFDSTGDGVFERKTTLVSGLAELTGIAVAADGTVYVSSTGRVSTVRDTNGDGVGDSTRHIITGLPSGRHQNNGMAFGPDGKLYLTNGSTCDDCAEANQLSATILQANRDGSGRRVFARGLRNPYDLVFDSSGRLWATDNGSDTPCATIDELNLIRDGGDFGWPYRPACDPYRDGTAPVADLGLHTASTGIDVYDGGQFPARYRGNLFATLWGSLFTTPRPYGPSLLRIVIESGPRGRVEVFGTGFANPIDTVVDRDGTLLVLDYGTGRLYRVVYTG